MSWPQWSAQTAPISNWPGVAGASVAGPGAAVGMAPMVGPQMVGAPVVGTQTVGAISTPGTPYTPEQWAAMQHQNWQQWVQWQQQYQQWQQQYGEQYQQSMSALSGQIPAVPTMPAQPPLPISDVKLVPPPLPVTKPPLPPDEPPKTVQSSLHQTPSSSVNFNSSVPPPGLMQSHSQPLLHTPHHQQQRQPYRPSQITQQLQGCNNQADLSSSRQLDSHNNQNFHQQPPPSYQQDSHQSAPTRSLDSHNKQDFHQQPSSYQSPQQDSRNRGNFQTFNNRDTNNRFNSNQQPPSLLNMNVSKPESYGDSPAPPVPAENQSYRSDKTDLGSKRLGDSMNFYDSTKKNRWESDSATDNKGWNANKSQWTVGDRLLPLRRNADESLDNEKNLNTSGGMQNKGWSTNQSMQTKTQWTTSSGSSEKLLPPRQNAEMLSEQDNTHMGGGNQNKSWSINQQTQHNPHWTSGSSADKLVPSRHLTEESLDKEKNFDNFNKHATNTLGGNQNKGWNANQTLQNNTQRTSAISEKSMPVSARHNVEELSDAEKNFDKQFEQWEAQFNKWKEQNAGHPDKQQYKEYEAKWESWRTQLLDRREQMRKKRLGLTGVSAQTITEKSITPSSSPSLSRQNSENFNPDKKKITDVERIPIKNELFLLNPTQKHTVEKMTEPKSEIITEPLDVVGEDLFTQPPKEQRANTRQRKISLKSEPDQSLLVDTSFMETESKIADTSYLQSNSVSDGIPGLDLVHASDKTVVDKEQSVVTPNEIEGHKGPDFEAISKGINSILGDQKLMNMLSLVSQNKVPVKTTDNVITAETFGPESNLKVGEIIFNKFGNQQHFNSDEGNYYHNEGDNIGIGSIPQRDQQNFGHLNHPTMNNLQPNNFNQTPSIMGANNFNRNFPPNRNDFGQYSSHEGQGTQDIHQGPSSREGNNFNSSNRGGFNTGLLNRRPSDLNQGFPNRDSADFNHSNNKFNYQGPKGSNDFSQGGMLNRGPNQGLPKGPNDFSQNRGPTHEFNQFSSSNRSLNNQNISNNRSSNNNPNLHDSSMLNRGPNNMNRGNHFDSNRGPNNFSPFSGDRRPNDFDRGSNQRQNFGPNESGHHSNRNQFDHFNRDSPNKGHIDFKSMRPNRMQNWGPNDSVNRGVWAQNEYDCNSQESEDLDELAAQCNETFGMDEHDDSRGQHMYDQQHTSMFMDQFKGNRRSGDSVSFDRPKFPSNTSPNFDPNIRESSEKYWDEALILKPATVVDYGHKSLIKEPEVFIEPIQTFDYGHSSKNVDKNAPEKNFNREPMNKYNRFNDPDYKKPYIEPPQQILKMNVLNRSNSFERDRRRYEKFELFKEREMNQLNTTYEKFEEKQPRERLIQKERSSCEREIKNEQFLNKPNPLDVKTDVDKSSSVTMIDDLLSAPGRNTRPPRIVLILRGPPGSGKTFLAKLIKDKEVEQGGSAPRILSLDDYFMVEQDKEVIENETGRKTTIKEMVYEYEECMETCYRQSLDKAFKKTVTDGFFPFIIVDCVNDKIKHFSEMWSFAKQKGFQVYICQMELDVAACTKRNIHHRSEIEIQRLVAGWDQTLSHYLTLDATSLIQAGCISEVEMEQVSDDEDELINDENEDHVNISKWERMEHSGDKLARLDGINKPLRPKATMEDYLQLEDVEIPEDRPGQKRVRWADLEERRRQDKIRAIGFVVGQTDWNRMMDPTQGGSALTQTKYIERVNKRF